MLADEKALLWESERLVLTGGPLRSRRRYSGAGREVEKLGNIVDVRSLGFKNLEILMV